MGKTDLTKIYHSEVQLLREKERTINIQQSYIERLEKTIERLEEDKKKRNQTIVPEIINKATNLITVPM